MFLTKSGRHKAPGGRSMATKALIATITGVMLAGASIAPAMATEPTNPGNSDPKVWVCKIVSSDNAPGGYELKAGKQPIHVSANALDADVNPVPGAPFSDAQPSFVVAEDNVQLCLNGLPKGDATGGIDIDPATCLIGETMNIINVSGATASGTPDGTTGPGNYSVTFTANAGYTFPGGNTLVFSGTLAGPLDPSNPACAPPTEERNPVFPTFSPDCVQETGEFSILFIATGELVDVTTGLYENEFSFIQVTVGPTTASATVTPKDGFVLAPPSEGGVQYVLNEDGSVTYSVDFTAFAEECGEDEEPQFINPPPVGASYDCINEEINLDLGGATLQDDGSYRWEFGSFRVNVDSPTVTFSFLTDPGYLFPEPGEGDNYTLVQGEGELGSDAVIVIDLSSEIEACDDVEPVKDFTAYSFGDCVEGEAGGFSGGFVLTNSEESTEDITHRVVVTNVETDEVVFDETEVVAPGTESELFTSLDEDSGEYLFEQYVDGELYDSFPADSNCRDDVEPGPGIVDVTVTSECLVRMNQETGMMESYIVVTTTLSNLRDGDEPVREVTFNYGAPETELTEVTVGDNETLVVTEEFPAGYAGGEFDYLVGVQDGNGEFQYAEFTVDTTACLDEEPEEGDLMVVVTSKCLVSGGAEVTVTATNTTDDVQTVRVGIEEDEEFLVEFDVNPGETEVRTFVLANGFGGGTATIYAGDANAPVAPQPVEIDTNCPPVVIPPVDPPKDPEPPVNNPPKDPEPKTDPPKALAVTGAADMNGALTITVLAMLAAIGMMIYGRRQNAKA